MEAREGGGVAFSDHGFEGRIIEDGERERKKKKHIGAELADKSIFYGRATGRVTTMANNNTLLLGPSHKRNTDSATITPA